MHRIVLFCKRLSICEVECLCVLACFFTTSLRRWCLAVVLVWPQLVLFLSFLVIVYQVLRHSLKAHPNFVYGIAGQAEVEQAACLAFVLFIHTTAS